MYIFVTGAAGFIGFHTIKRLLLLKKKVIGIDNLNNYYDINLKKNRINFLKKNFDKNFKFFKMDLKKNNQIISIFKKYKISIVINLAAQAGVRYSLKEPRQYLDSNIIGFFNLLETSKNFKVKRFIFASTSSVYGNNIKIPFKEEHTADHPIQFYAATKRSNELIAHSYSSLYGIETIGLRFFTVYGPWGRPDMALFKFVKNILNKEIIEIYNNGNHIRDFTYIDDIVDGIILTVHSNKIFHDRLSKKNNLTPDRSNSKFRVFNIGSGKEISLMKYINLIEKELKLKAYKKFLPLQKGDIRKTLANINNLKKIGYKPKIGPKKGIKNFVNWYKNYYNIK